MRLGVNIDHIATLRQARKIHEPDPLEAIFVLKNAGADQVTAHLREDRRHMNDFDIKRLIENSPLPTNIESSSNKEILDFLFKLKPNSITLVPENRAEITTEGGLKLESRHKKIIKECKKNNIKISLFIDPNIDDIKRAKEFGADSIELHTGKFANLFLILFSNLNRTPNRLDWSVGKNEYEREIERLKKSAKEAKKLGLGVFAGHGLNYQNIIEIKKIKEIEELNIGHSIIARSVFSGLFEAIKEMRNLLKD